MDYRLADPRYVGFVPKTASEAIVKFRRLQDTGISPFQYPETFCDCAKALNNEELCKFEEWLVCPQGEPDKDCVSVEVFSGDNLKVHNQLLLELGQETDEQDDEKAVT